VFLEEFFLPEIVLEDKLSSDSFCFGLFLCFKRLDDEESFNKYVEDRAPRNKEKDRLSNERFNWLE
jgi:hypothetical protein